MNQLVRLSYSVDRKEVEDEGWRMARKLRIQYPGAIYHVVNRGDRREAIFADDADRQRFLELAWTLRAKTTMPLARIAERLSMGSRGHLAWLLQQRRKGRLAPASDQCLLAI